MAKMNYEKVARQERSKRVERAERQAFIPIGPIGVTTPRFRGTCCSCTQPFEAGTEIQKWIGGWRHLHCPEHAE